MNIWENTVITAKGVALLSKLVQGNTLTITKAVSGAGYVTPGMLQNQTAVANPKQTLNFRSFSFPSEGKSEVTCYLTNDGLTEAYTAQQIGVYAKDPDEGDILFFITQAVSGTGTIVPTETESPGFSAEWSFTFPYGQADTVSVTVDPSNTVTQASMETYVAEAISPLWPTKEATGSAIFVEDSANLPLAGLHIYGKSTQEGTPTPDNPVEIVNIGDDGEVTIKCTGKNLIPYPYYQNSATSYGVTFTAQADGGISGSGIATDATGINIYDGDVLGSGMITASLSGTFTNMIWQIVLLDASNNELLKLQNMQKATIDLEEYPTAIRMRLFVKRRTNSEVSGTVYPQLEIGEVATEYEAYKSGNSVTIPTPTGLPGIPVTSGGNYTDENGQQWVCDEVDLARGVYVQRIGHRILNGSDNWEKSSTTAGIFYVQNKTGIKEPKTGILSEIFITDTSPLSQMANNSAKCDLPASGTSYLYIRSDKFNDFTVTDLNEYFSDNPTTIMFILETPVETALTAEEITAYQSLLMNNPCTTVLNDAGAGMKVVYATNTFERLMKSITLDSIGAAPAGLIQDRYDINTEADLTSAIADLWNRTSGWSEGHFALNMRASVGQLYGGVWHLTAYKTNNDYGVIKIVGYNASHPTVMYRNKMQTWSEWEWDNPPMQPGVEYRTTERRDGKAVYAKSIVYTLSEAVSTGPGGWERLVIPHRISNFRYAVRLDGQYSHGESRKRLIPSFSAATGGIITFEECDGYNITLLCYDHGFNTCTIEIDLYYTKTE